jgi:hypothetical protein
MLGATGAGGRARQYGNAIKPPYQPQIPHFVRDDSFLLFSATCEAGRYKCRMGVHADSRDLRLFGGKVRTQTALEQHYQDAVNEYVVPLLSGRFELGFHSLLTLLVCAAGTRALQNVIQNAQRGSVWN